MQTLEEKIEKVVVKYLKKHEDKINIDKLREIRAEVYKKTGKYKTISFAVVKKWVKDARKIIRKQKKNEEKKQEKPKEKKIKIHAKPVIGFMTEEQEEKKIDEREIKLQNILYEISSVKKMLEGINRRLNSIEQELQDETTNEEI